MSDKVKLPPSIRITLLPMSQPSNSSLSSQQPKVSVIIASYNGERFVAEAVGSILDQTWRDLELVVVDDGSTDGTRAILHDIASRDSRLRIIEKANEGLIATLNRAIVEARGAYIARLDHDDVSRPTRIERQARFLDANPDFIGVGCLMQSMTQDGTYVGKVRIRHERLQHSPGSFPPRQQWLYGPTPMIRAAMLRKAGGYREKFLASEDRDLCWRLGDLGRLERLPEVLVDYRYHGTNMSRLRRRTQIYSALMSDLSAIARHFRLDDSSVIESIDIGGDYTRAVAGYRRLLTPHYPVDSYLYFYQMRSELWDLAGFPVREDFLPALLKHVAQRPFDPDRLLLLRRSFVYLTRKPRAPGGHRPMGI